MGITRDKKNGAWIASYSKRHPVKGYAITKRKKAVTEAEAKRIEKQLILEVERKCLEIVSPAWANVVAEFEKHMISSGLGTHTIYCYMSGLATHTLEIWGPKSVSEITASEIRDLVKIGLSNKAESHRKNVLKHIRAVFRFAKEKGYVDIDPTPQLKFQKVEKLGTVLTEAQMKKLLSVAEEMNSPWYWHWLLACYLGLRNGELYALKWDRIDFENRRILVNLSWQKHGGFKGTKSGDDRWVEISPTLLHPMRKLKLETGATGFVLPRLREWDQGEQARCLRMFLLGLGIPPVRFHDLRASWATMMLNKGLEPIKVMSMGGWKDLKTMQCYIRKAGVDTKGIMDDVDLLDRNQTGAQLVSISLAGGGGN